MNVIADQDRILQLVENENDSPQVPRRDKKERKKANIRKAEKNILRNTLERF